MNYYDPYFLKDPTIPHSGIAIQGRSHGGKFTHKSILNTLADENLPIDSNGWAMYGRGAISHLEKIVGSDFAFEVLDTIFPNETIEQFSWRMICEMVELSATQAEKTPTDKNAIVSAARDYLKAKHEEIQKSLALESIDTHPVIQAYKIEKSMGKEVLIRTGEIPDSKCPKCGKPLQVINKARYLELETKRQFVGCIGYPRCDYKAQKISGEVIDKMAQVQAQAELQEVEF